MDSIEDVVEQPNSRESEEAIVGCVLINPDIYKEFGPFLEPEDFYTRRLGTVWGAFGSLVEKGSAIDLLTLQEALGASLDDVGGSSYLLSLLNVVPTTLNAAEYAQIVKATSTRRKLLAAANHIATMAYDESADTSTVLDKADTEIRKVAIGFGNKSTEAVHIEDVAKEHYERTVKASRGQNPAIMTPWKDLNTMLGGLHGSDMILVAGRPGQGKTSLMIDASLFAARAGNHVVVATLEMANLDLYGRFISQTAHIDGQRLRDGKLTVEEWESYNLAQEHLQNLPIHFIDSPNLTISELRMKLRKIDSVEKIDMIVLDYLQLVNGQGRQENRNLELSFISRSIKQMAREFDVPFLAAAQLSREIEKRADKEPVMSDLRDSGSLEQDSDIIMFIVRDADDPVNSGITRLKIAKQRNGPTGSVTLRFDGPTTSFKDVKANYVGIEPYTDH